MSIGLKTAISNNMTRTQLSRQQAPNSVCEVCSKRSRDLDALGSREVMVVMKVQIVWMVAVVVSE